MTKSIPSPPVDSTNLALQPALPLKWLFGLVFALSLALIPAFYFVKSAANEATKYSSYTFESFAREALDAQDYAHALQICQSAIRSSLAQSEHWGTAHLLSARACAGLDDIPAALHELQTTARLWSERYYFAKPQDRQEALEFAKSFGMQLLQKQDAAGALRAFSAGAVAGGDPVRALHSLVDELTPEQRQLLWSRTPYLILEDFDDPASLPRPGTETQAKAVSATSIQADSATGSQSAYAEITPVSGVDQCFLSIPVYLPLTQEPFVLRACVKVQTPASEAFRIGYWFEAAQKSASTVENTPNAIPDGWTVFQMARPFYQEREAEAAREGYGIEGGFINQAGIQFDATQPNRIWLDRIEIYLP